MTREMYFVNLLEDFGEKPCLYIVNSIGTNLYKIGITSNIKNRFKQLDSSYGLVLTIYKVCFFEDIKTALEQEQKFKNQHRKFFRVNEWFECTAQELWRSEETIWSYQFSHYIDRDLYDKNKMERMGGVASVTHI